MFGGGCAPGGPGVVDQNVDGADFLMNARDQRVNRLEVAQVVSVDVRLDPQAFEVGLRLVEFVLLAGGQDHHRAVLAQGLGDLQAQPA